ncbi:WXG100 family type VII secretion target [Goodfellowiella coeruleoviolacea]|uniref:Uncharacterized protein n=1 Tax=Goodfellowiella coeruleoviolacea TaxID=334858 RepID=A0AAE3GF26_9PSEU|nr:transcriptional regulator [Goodfellowiella coeruleoviolacea]MCP2166139.1 hypothetical protein [Goodfellowiella coeruleoviolacea]
MFINEGVGAGVGSVPPSYAGKQQKLQVDPSAIPETRKLFESALDKLNEQLELLGQNAAISSEWAGDPVSAETQKKFNESMFGSASDSAMQALIGYRQQLKDAADALRGLEEQYRAIEGDNTALWGKYHNS